MELMGISDSRYGALRHILVDPSYKRMGQGAPFSHACVSNEVASQWMNRTRVLHDNVQDARGQLTKVPKHPVDSVPAPDENILREVLGTRHLCVP